jgi:hypothetical protein
MYLHSNYSEKGIFAIFYFNPNPNAFLHQKLEGKIKVNNVQIRFALIRLSLPTKKLSVSCCLTRLSKQKLRLYCDILILLHMTFFCLKHACIILERNVWPYICRYRKLTSPIGVSVFHCCQSFPLEKKTPCSPLRSST